MQKYKGYYLVQKLCTRILNYFSGKCWYFKLHEINSMLKWYGIIVGKFKPSNLKRSWENQENLKI